VCRVWSRDNRCTTNVEGRHEVKGQDHDIKEDPSQVK